MTPTSVGMRCPECAGQTTQVKRVARRSPGSLWHRPVVWNDLSTWTATHILIAINVVVFLAEVGTGVSLGGSNDHGWVIDHGFLAGPLLLSPYHQYYRLLTSGFLHESIWHIGINMMSLWFVGRSLEPAVGKLYFTAIYFTSLLVGSFGAVLFTPGSPTLGASGAIFGIFGALIVIAHARHISLWQSGLMPMLILNLVFTLSVSGISIGGHAGGLVAGLITGKLVVEFGEKRDRRSLVLLGCLAIAVASVFAAIAVGGNAGLLPNGNVL
jgi:membrane associated rhomboid family serine protease